MVLTDRTRVLVAAAAGVLWLLLGLARDAWWPLFAGVLALAVAAWDLTEVR